MSIDFLIHALTKFRRVMLQTTGNGMIAYYSHETRLYIYA